MQLPTMITVLVPLLSAFALCVFFTVLQRFFFPKLGLLDRPQDYGYSRAPLPYPGGVAILFAFLICSVLFLPDGLISSMIICGAILLGLVSFMDDIFRLSPFLRLFIQMCVGFILVFGGIGIESLPNPFGGVIDLNFFGLSEFGDLFTVLWVMAMINAFNWSDGVPGMSSGLASVSAIVLLVLSLRPEFHSVDQSLALTLSSIIFGLSFGFFLFDAPPPKQIIGDTGTMLLGYLLAVTAIVSGGKIATAFLVLGLPLLDFIWAILRRLKKGQSPFQGDLLHFHHHLLRGGFSQKQIVVVFLSISSFFGLLALFLDTGGKALAVLALAALMLILRFFFS